MDPTSIEQYKAAIDTHKFYDTISTSLIAGQITVSGAAFYLYKEIKGTLIETFPFIGAALCVVILLLIYRHCAYYANVARNVAAAIEEGNPDCLGVSHALQKNIFPAQKSWKKGIYGKNHLLTLLLVAGLLATAIRLGHWL